MKREHNINLLPPASVRALSRLYYARLFTLAFTLIAIAFVVGGVLIVPSYILASRAADAGERYLAALQETVGVRERAGVSDETRALAERLRILDTYTNEASFAPMFESLFGDLEPSIHVSQVAFSKGPDALQVSIAGAADTRAALIAFAKRLEDSGSFEGVSVPVSQLAADENLPFSITATYRSTP